MTRLTSSKILATAARNWELPIDRFQINKGDCYYWIAYDYPEEGIYESHSVMVACLNDLTMQHWMEEFQQLMDLVREQNLAIEAAVDKAMQKVEDDPLDLLRAYQLVTSYIAAAEYPEHWRNEEETSHLRRGEYEGQMVAALEMIETRRPDDARGLVAWFAKHAPGILDYDAKGNWTGPVANENGWTA